MTLFQVFGGKKARLTKVSAVILSLSLVAHVAVGYTKVVAPSVKVRDVEIRLGAPTDATIKALQKNFFVRDSFSNSDAKSLMHKLDVSTEKNGLPFAILYVKGNSVVGVEYMLTGPDSNSAEDVFGALFTATSKLSAEGQNTCMLSSSSEFRPPDLSKAAITFDCGVYRLRLQRYELRTTEGRAMSGYMVWESLGTTD